MLMSTTNQPTTHKKSHTVQLNDDLFLNITQKWNNLYTILIILLLQHLLLSTKEYDKPAHGRLIIIHIAMLLLLLLLLPLRLTVKHDPLSSLTLDQHCFSSMSITKNHYKDNEREM